MRSVFVSEGPALTIRQAAESVGVARDLLYEAIGRGELPEVEGVVKRVRMADVEAWLDLNPPYGPRRAPLG